MALVLKDRVRESSTSSGTGSITLGGAFTGYQTFASAVASGSTVYYTIHNTTAGNDGEWEVGVGTFTSPSTLSRDTVFSSSAGGTTKVNFTGSSVLEVFITQPAEQAVYINQATSKVEAFGNGTNSISFVNVTADLFTGNASAISAINASNISSGTIDNARTTANSSNGASTIVLRDSNGSFAGNVITGTTGSFTNVSGNGVALTAINASNISSGTIANARTTASDANGASTIVARDANGSFTANVGTFTTVTGNHTSGSWTGTTIGAQYGGTGSANLTANNVILGNGASAVQVVAPGTANNVLTSNGTTWISQAAGGGFASGTVMLFAQTSAPSGWTKNTSTGDNHALRVVTGTASSGGSVGFTTAFASQTPSGSVSITAVSGSAGATTLSTPQIPSHTHTVPAGNNPSVGCSNMGNNPPTTTQNSGATGGGGSHTHPFSFSSGSGTFSGNAINLAVQYIDVIRASKD